MRLAAVDVVAMVNCETTPRIPLVPNNDRLIRGSDSVTSEVPF